MVGAPGREHGGQSRGDPQDPTSGGQSDCGAGTAQLTEYHD